MSLNDIVDVQISLSSSAVTLPGFGRPLILPPTVPFAERARIYSNPDDMLADGFLTTSPAYLESLGIASQSPRPIDWMVGRRDPSVAMKRTVVVKGNVDGTYRIQIDGTNFDFAAVAQTITQIRDALVTAINLGTRPVTAAAVGTDRLTLTADNAGIQFVALLFAPTSGLLKFQQIFFVFSSDPGVYAVIINNAFPSSFLNVASTVVAIRDALVAALNTNTPQTGVVAVPTLVSSAFLESVDDFTVAIQRPLPTSMTLNAGGEWIANVGIPEALAAIEDFNPDWYGLLITERTDLAIESAARSIETRRKLFLAQSSSAAIISAPYDSGNIDFDIASRMHGLSFARTSVWYHPDDTAALAASVMGRMLATVPGSSTWKFKTLAGVEPVDLTDNQQFNLRGNPQSNNQGKCANSYSELAGRNITYEGTVAVGEFLDIIHGVDKLFSDVQANVLGILFKEPKVPFTSGGFQQIASGIRAALQTSVLAGLIAPSRTLVDGTIQTPAFSIFVPNVSDIPQADREKRHVPASNPFTFEGTLAGAVHAVAIRGTLAA